MAQALDAGMALHLAFVDDDQDAARLFELAVTMLDRLAASLERP